MGSWQSLRRGPSGLQAGGYLKDLIWNKLHHQLLAGLQDIYPWSSCRHDGLCILVSNIARLDQDISSYQMKCDPNTILGAEYRKIVVVGTSLVCRRSLLSLEQVESREEEIDSLVKSISRVSCEALTKRSRTEFASLHMSSATGSTARDVAVLYAGRKSFRLISHR